MQSSVITLALGAAGVALFAACGGSTSPYGGGGGGCTPTATKVCMVGSVPYTAFSPVNLTITAGTTVTWQNGSIPTHTVKSSSTSTEVFNSGDPPAGVTTGGTFSHTFSTPGTYHYYCQYHGTDGNPPTGMAGTITVQP